MVSRDFGSSGSTPAAARAAEIDAAVRLENATGAPPSPDGAPLNVSRTATGPTHSAATPETALSPGSADGTQQADLDRFAPPIVRGLSAMVNQRGGVLTMRLDPPDLGTLRVQMTIAAGSVSAVFSAENPQARALLEQHMPALRGALETHGLSVERLAVHAPASTAPSMLRDDSGGDPHASRDQSQSDADAGRGHSRGRRDDESREFARRFALAPDLASRSQFAFT